MENITKAKLKCPECGAVQEAQMPVDACIFFYNCEKCKTILRPKSGDCCVFCSYGDRPCPPKQIEKG